jgi:hypothetical protein
VQGSRKSSLIFSKVSGASRLLPKSFVAIAPEPLTLDSLDLESQAAFAEAPTNLKNYAALYDQLFVVSRFHYLYYDTEHIPVILKLLLAKVSGHSLTGLSAVLSMLAFQQR